MIAPRSPAPGSGAEPSVVLLGVRGWHRESARDPIGRPRSWKRSNRRRLFPALTPIVGRALAYYGLSYSERRSDIGLPQDSISESEGTRGKASHKRAVTRSEEEFKVGKRQTETGTARLRKWVETEPAQADVELKRETARVRRESIDRPVSGAEIREEEIEVPLRAEQAVVEKRTVAKERVGIEQNVETRHETVADEVRKERVEVDMDNVEERKR